MRYRILAPTCFNDSKHWWQRSAYCQTCQQQHYAAWLECEFRMHLRDFVWGLDDLLGFVKLYLAIKAEAV